ncbi:MAG: hypothetical protein Q9186_005039 [Xanthomendoza sp. 1 TL-2023]
MRYGFCALRWHARSIPQTPGLVRSSQQVFPRIPSRFYASVSTTDLQFGQPLHETHPHLLKAGEPSNIEPANQGEKVTPGITASEYAQRRSKLASKLPKNGVAILAASDVKYRSGAVFYEFHQDSDFFYLTGFNEPEAVAVIGKSTVDDDHSFHLFVRPKDPKVEQWEGSRSGTQAAVDVFNADESGDIKDIERLLAQSISDASEIFTDSSPSQSSASAFSRLFKSKPSFNATGLAKLLDQKTVKPLRSILHSIRYIKSVAEITNMRKAGQASGRALTEAMRHSWTTEKDLAAFLEYTFKRNGCDTSAYVPVVARGKVHDASSMFQDNLLTSFKNASQIHYVRNDDVLPENDLVLADAGGQYGNYITDITRVWPISRTFSPPQKDLYNAVLATQRTCIALCRADAANSLDRIHQIAESSLRDSLKGLGFDMRGDALETLFPHHLGHYIGLEIHDTPDQSRKIPLEAGQCVAIEPGIYVPDTDRWPVAFRGIAVRIEDSVCVQDENPLVLTTEAVKEVDDIEALRS